jgi:hypothetical protein
MTCNIPACTAVVTQIAYHAAKTIEGHVSFLNEEEWMAELETLCGDCT